MLENGDKGGGDVPRVAVNRPTWSAPAKDSLIRFRKGTVKPIDMCLLRTSVCSVKITRQYISPAKRVVVRMNRNSPEL